MASIKLKTRDGRQLWATVDDDDFDLVERMGPWYPWMRGPNLYPEQEMRYAGERIRFLMHTLLLGFPPPGLRTCHINGNGLDNQRANLKFATQAEILAKRKPSPSRGGSASRYKGVCWDGRSKWLVQFRGKKVGRFTDEIEAAKAFDAAALAFWGSGVYLNFPDERRASSDG
jgi:hypothetical protein